MISNPSLCDPAGVSHLLAPTLCRHMPQPPLLLPPIRRTAMKVGPTPPTPSKALPPSLAYMGRHMTTAMDTGTAVEEMHTDTGIAMKDTDIAMKGRDMSLDNMVTVQDNRHIASLDMSWEQLHIVSMCLGPASCMLEVGHTQL